MTDDEILKDLLTGGRNRNNMLPAVLKWAEVVKVDEDEKTMDVKVLSDELEMYDVQLGTGSVVLYPKVGTMCLVGLIEGLDTDGILISATEIDKMEVTAGTEILLNGGENGGLINIEALTDKINALVDSFNNHTHMLASGTVAVTGSPSAQSNPAPITVPAIQQKAQKLNKDDYEDIKVKH